MKPVPENQQQALVSRLMKACGGAYTPETRRKYYISGPQWAAAYQGQALFHAPTREAVGFEEVIRKYGEIGIGYWTTHDTDVIPTEALGKDRAGGDRRPHRRGVARERAEVLHGHHRDVLSRGVGGQSRGGSAGGSRVRQVPRAQHGGHRPRTGRAASRSTGRDRWATTCRARWRRRRRCAGTPRRSMPPASAISRSPPPENAPDAEALPGGQAIRAAGGDSTAHQRRDAGVHFLGIVDASGDGRPESGVSARTDVGRRAAGRAGARPAGGQAVPLRYQRRLSVEARRGYRGRPGESARLAERAGAAAQPRL